MEQTQQLNRRGIPGAAVPEDDVTLDELTETTKEGSPAFESILFAKPEDDINQKRAEIPDFFRDLNLDQIVDGITVGKAGYDLKPFFYTPLGDIDAIAYRHEVFHDLEAAGLLESVRSFAAKMGEMREHLTAAARCTTNIKSVATFWTPWELIVRLLSALLRSSYRSVSGHAVLPVSAVIYKGMLTPNPSGRCWRKS